MLPDSVKVPAPALLKVTPLPLMMPVTVAVLLSVMASAPLVAKAIAPALRVAVLMVRLVNAAVPPTAPVKVVEPVVVVDRLKAPLTVELNKIAPVLVPVVKVDAAPKVTAPL